MAPSWSVSARSIISSSSASAGRTRKRQIQIFFGVRWRKRLSAGQFGWRGALRVRIVGSFKNAQRVRSRRCPILLFGSSPVMVSPSSLATRLRFLSDILPLLSSSNRLKTFMTSSRESLSDCKRRQWQAKRPCYLLILARLSSASSSGTADHANATLGSVQTSADGVHYPDIE